MQTFEILIIAVGGLVFLLTLYFVFFHKKFKNSLMIKKMEKKFEKLKNNKIEQKLLKIENISQSNPSYVEVYNSLKDRYMNLSIDMIAKMEGDILKIKIMLEEGNYKEASVEVKNTSNELTNLNTKYSSLENDVDKIIKEEDEIREKLVPIKERLRQLKSEFFSSKEEFSECKDGFEAHITRLEGEVFDIEENIKKGYYKEAKEAVVDLDNDVNFYLSHVKKLPKLISFSLQVLPKRFEDSLKRYEELKEEGFPLHIVISTYKEQVQNAFEEFKVRYEELKYEGIETEVKELALKIEKFNESLQNERNAKETFDEKIDVSYEKFSLIGKKYIKASRLLTSVQAFFYIADRYKEELVMLENRLRVADRIKSDLDGLIHSITKHPYSTLSKKMNELYDYCLDMDDKLNQFIDFIESLGVTSQKTYDDVNKYSIALNTEKNRLRVINHEVLTNKYQKDIESSFLLIDEINKLLSVKPINVEILTSKLNNMMVNIDLVLKNIKDSISLHNMAQNIIVFTNRYRSSFTDVDQVLNQAQIHFENAEFEFAIDRVSEVLQDVHPKAYEEMMKRKGINSNE